MIPLVVLDLDGTIIGKQGHVQDCVWEAVDKAQQAGMKFAVCTGRLCIGQSQKIAQRLGPNHLHIFQSGAHIGYTSGEAYKVFALKEAVAKQLIEVARDLSLVLEIYTPSTLYVERTTALSEAHAKMLGTSAIVRDLMDVIENEPVIRAQWVVTEDEYPMVSDLKFDGVQASSATAPAQKGAYFVSLTQKGVSKGTSLALLAKAMKVDLKDVMAVGDSHGDLPMLECVGFPVVMANASEDLKNAYSHHAGDVETCGIVDSIEFALNHPLPKPQ
jgi:Cof subfamily protein (haloacid dehalogenase superfamily)